MSLGHQNIRDGQIWAKLSFHGNLSFQVREDLCTIFDWPLRSSARIYSSPPSPFSAHFLLLRSPRQSRHPTYNHFPRKISSSRFHIAGLSKLISSCLLQTGPMLYRCQIWYLNNEKGNSRLVGLKYFELLQIPNLQVFSNSGESDAQMQWVQIHQFVTDCTNFPSSSSPLVTFPWFSCALLFLWLLLFLHLSILVAVRFLRSWPAAITSTNRPISRRKQHQTTRSQYNPGSYNL